MSKPLSYYSRKPSGAKQRTGRKIPRKVFGLKNRYDAYSSVELYSIWERAKDKLQSCAPFPRLANAIMHEISLIESSKNWIK